MELWETGFTDYRHTIPNELKIYTVMPPSGTQLDGNPQD